MMNQKQSPESIKSKVADTEEIFITNQVSSCLIPSLRSRSFKKAEELLETSFEVNTVSPHANDILQASINYTQSSISGESIKNKEGLNSNILFPHQFELSHKEKQFKQIFRKCSLLETKQIQQFQLDLQNEKQLTKLLQSLCDLFRQEIFHQILYVVHRAWQEYLIFKSQTKLDLNFLNMNCKTIFDFDRDIEESFQEQFSFLSVEELNKKSSQCAEEIAGLLYLMKKIKYINLMQANIKKKNFGLRENFAIFIKSIVRAVYFTIQGVYDTEQENREVDQFESFMSSSSEDEQNEDEEESEQSDVIRKQRKNY